MRDRLLARLKSRDAKIGIVGLGYVGLPLVLRFSEVGYSVVGFDIDNAKVAALLEGRSYIDHITPDRVSRAIGAGFEPTTDFSKASDVDALILCVPTPLNKHREPDLTFVTDTVDSLLPHLVAGQVMSLESTTYPGTTEEELLPRIAARGFNVGTDYFLIYSPEREDPGNPDFTTRTIPKVCGGHTASCLEVAKALYGQVIDRLVPVSSTKAAELTKLLENIQRSVNIGLVNEMKMIADKMGIDIFEVVDAAKTKPFGFTAYYPGPGIGGHCIPIDPFYLTWKAREYGLNTHFIELAGEINRDMPNWVVGKIVAALNEREKSLKNARILALGIAYKRDVDDMRESPAVFVMELLRDRGAKVDYSDPFVPVFPKMREHRFDLESVPLTPETLASYDCVVLLTDHSKLDYDMILKHSRLLVDTRGKYRQVADNLVGA
ncbi:MAG: nucleotide sugar dehydrogenase [Rhizobiaceae bacterium]